MEALPERAESILGYQFEDQELLMAALTPMKNEQKRLAIVGSEALRLVTADEWYVSGADL
ncbi:hypothetical protein LTR49_028845, partial [Elasticomyces elasticus]